MMAKKVKEKYTGPRVKDTETFIQKARWVHGDKYDYGNTTYKNNRTKVSIVCPSHGVFHQLPRAHVHNGSGCPSCVGRAPWDLKRFLEDAVKVHGNEYNYDLVECITRSKDKISIICNKHGVFEQSAACHIYNANGCPMCYGRNLENEERINKFIAVHGDKYDYSKVSYTLSKNKVTVVCRHHGDFLVSPNNHLFGRGCPKCSARKSAERAKGCPNFSKLYYQSNKNKSNLYLLVIDQKFCKVGLAKDVPTRMRVISNSVDAPVEKLYSVSGKARELFELEQNILRRSGLKRFYPEETFGGSTECLELSELPKVLKIIKEWEEEQKSEEDA